MTMDIFCMRYFVSLRGEAEAINRVGILFGISLPVCCHARTLCSLAMTQCPLPLRACGLSRLQELLMKKAHKKPLCVLYVKFRLFWLEIVVYFKR